VLEMAHRYVHLILLDVVMPPVDGVLLGREISARWPTLRLLYMSAHPAEVLAENGLSDLRVQFLAKPFTRDELLKKVQESLERRKAPRDSGGVPDYG
jgi:two-component system cell cycle sensor histidine kinase/response regulator CckA